MELTGKATFTVGDQIFDLGEGRVTLVEGHSLNKKYEIVDGALRLEVDRHNFCDIESVLKESNRVQDITDRVLRKHGLR